MSHLATITPLSSHTFTSLCDELVSGRGIQTDEGTVFRFGDETTRAIFDWYRQNRDRWTGQNRTEHVEAIVAQLDKQPPFLPTSMRAGSIAQGILHLKRLRAHRFAGLHRFGTPDNPPEDFECEFNGGVTLLEGKNGSGKTSILNAISWCLTGYTYRAQREPERTEQEVEVTLDEGCLPEGATATVSYISSITPKPSADVLQGLEKGAVPLDTWVELTFVDDDGREAGTIRRSVQRTARGKLQISEPDFSRLGLDPIAREVGTRMPAILPYIQLDESSDMGRAVASLTGLKQLQEVAGHAAKSKEKLEKVFPREREKAIAALQAKLQQKRANLESLLRDHPEIAPPAGIPEVTLSAQLESWLREAESHLERLQGEAFARARTILGASFDPGDRSTQRELAESIGPALGALERESLSRLPNLSRLSSLSKLSETELANVEHGIEKLCQEARDLADMERSPSRAARLKLYARVSGWMNEHPELVHPHDSCQVCCRPLTNVTDPITREPVATHIRFFLSAADYVQHTLRTWERSRVATLVSALPTAIQAESRRDLPERPVDLLISALTEELFRDRTFQGSLAPLREDMRRLCAGHSLELPPFREPPSAPLPAALASSKSEAQAVMGRVLRAIAFARWFHANDAALKTFYRKVVGTKQMERVPEPGEGQEISLWPLSRRLLALDRLVKDATPQTQALLMIREMSENLVQQQQERERIQRYRRAAEAIAPLIELRELVDRQVETLLQKLDSETRKWRNRLYRPAFNTAPEVVAPAVSSTGALAFKATSEGTSVAAQHVTNASSLHSTLLAFLLAFWHHLLRDRGGLSLLLLDDAQELLDLENHRRLANAIPHIVRAKGRVILTTHNAGFGRLVRGSCSEALGSERLCHRRILPLNAHRNTVGLGVFHEEIDEKRLEFKNCDNDERPAREYLRYLRIYLEAQLLDLFDLYHAGLSEKATLSELVRALRTRVNGGSEPFQSQVFRKLADDRAMEESSAFLKLMNQAHHHSEVYISYTDVEDISNDCDRIRGLVELAHEEYDRWLRREPLPEPGRRVATPAPVAVPRFTVPMLRDLAAFSGIAPDYDDLPAEEFTADWFDNKAIYYLATDNFGFAAAAGSRVIVSLEEEAIRGNRLVIALYKKEVLARRLLRDKRNPGLVVLGSEVRDPRNRRDAFFAPADQVRLMKVRGVLFDPTECRGSGRGEAIHEAHSPLLDRIEVVFKVREESALPLALDRQKILGGKQLRPDQLAQHEGKVVALSTSEGRYLKRVGDAVPGAPHVRHFESVGGEGKSLLLRTEPLEDGFSAIPTVISAREVLGVLYDRG